MESRSSCDLGSCNNTPLLMNSRSAGTLVLTFCHQAASAAKLGEEDACSWANGVGIDGSHGSGPHGSAGGVCVDDVSREGSPLMEGKLKSVVRCQFDQSYYVHRSW
jgi:hypothetical protein